jgi:hypothetical protein
MSVCFRVGNYAQNITPNLRNETATIYSQPRLKTTINDLDVYPLAMYFYASVSLLLEACAKQQQYNTQFQFIRQISHQRLHCHLFGFPQYPVSILPSA